MGFIMYVLVFVLYTAPSSSRRVKRVLNAEPIQGRTTGYSAVSYFAAIGFLHSIVSYAFWKSETGNVICGGALITKDIVQTACHCLTYTNVQLESRVNYPKLNVGLEKTLVVYVGVNRRHGDKPDIFSMSYAQPMNSKKFLVHQKCAKLPKSMTSTIPYDFGWIVIDSKIGDWDDRRMQWVTFAPQYTDFEILKIYYHLTERSAVCLHLGFGIPGLHTPQASEYLSHGWAYLKNDWACTDLSAHGMTVENISQWFTWVCSSRVSKYFQPVTKGDSGSPFTCNNHYFGVVSGGQNLQYYSTHHEFLNFHAAISYAVDENAINRRPAFIKRVLEVTAPSPHYSSLRRLGEGPKIV